MVGSQTTAPMKTREGISAALLENLTIQRTAALRAELAARPDIALIAVTHNLAAQIFYQPMYGLPSSLTVRTDAYSDRVDLRSASESQAAKALAKQTHDVRQLLPAKIDGLWEMAAGTASERSPERAGRRCGPHGRLLCKVRTMSLPQAAWARQTRWPRRSDLICPIGGRPPPRITSVVSRKSRLSKQSKRQPELRLMSG